MSVHDQSLKSLWQNLPTQRLTITAEQMRERARKFEAKHKRRDIIEYSGYALLFALTAYMCLRCIQIGRCGSHQDWLLAERSL